MLHTTNPVIKHKAGLLNLAEELSNVPMRQLNRLLLITPSLSRHTVSTGPATSCVNRTFLSPAVVSVLSGWLPHNLENFKKRLKALEEKGDVPANQRHLRAVP